MVGITRRNFVFLLPITLLAACQTGRNPSRSMTDLKDISRIETYLNDNAGIQGNFMQVWPDGKQSTGHLTYLPGQLRLDYDQPSRMVVVAKGKRMVAKDFGNQSVTHIGLARNPLGLMLHRPVLLKQPIIITAIQRNTNSIQISLASADNPSQGLLTLSFYDVQGKLALYELQAVDARNNHSQMHLYDIKPAGVVSENLFTYPDS